MMNFIEGKPFGSIDTIVVPTATTNQTLIRSCGQWMGR